MLFSPISVPPAYLDPGSGSMIIQLTIAALLGLGILVRSQWSKIKQLFSKKNNTDDTDLEE